MAAYVTRSQIAARIRVAADQPNAGGKFPDAVLFPLIEEAVYALYDLLIAGHGADYYSRVAYRETEPFLATVDLPEDFYQLEAILINDSPLPFGSDGRGGQVKNGELLEQGWHELPRLVKGELARRRNLPGTCARHLVYATTGEQDGGPEQIRLFPTPKGTFGLQLVYIPVCSQREVEGGGPTEVTYNGINGWEAYVVAYVVEQMAAIVEDSVVTYWQGKKAEVAARIAALATHRDQAQPERVADRTGDCDDDRYGYGGRDFDDSWV